MIPGTQGYAENSASLLERYEELAFPIKHAAVMDRLPTASVAALDIGAGIGADAQWLAEHGHRVVAVEPTDAFREFAAAHHASPRITWVNDSLPRLASLEPNAQQFGLIMATAVWMPPAMREWARGQAEVRGASSRTDFPRTNSHHILGDLRIGVQKLKEENPAGVLFCSGKLATGLDRLA